MIFGTIREIKQGENRVGITPNGVAKLKEKEHEVLVETGAGVGSGFSDDDYRSAGARIRTDPGEIAKWVNVLVKVKEPIPEEYHVLEKLRWATLFTYLHLSGVPRSLTEKLLEYEITGIAYETIKDSAGGLPLLKPMSEIAGVLAVQEGAHFLLKQHGGCGVTIGNIEGTPPARVVIIGGGVAGVHAAKTALGMGAFVTLVDTQKKRVEELKKFFEVNFPSPIGVSFEITSYGACIGGQVEVIESNSEARPYLNERIQKAHLLVGAVSSRGKRAPEVVPENVVRSMMSGAVIVDIAIDQGGCIWGSIPTTHENPVYKHAGCVYYCVSNMPGQVPTQSTIALTSATLPYLLEMGKWGIDAMLKKDPLFKAGLNTHMGKITCKPVAEDLDMMDKYLDPEVLLGK
jgi:alanine dehydrogenase